MNVYTVETLPAQHEKFGYMVRVTVEQRGDVIAVIDRMYRSGWEVNDAMTAMLDTAQEWYPPLDYANEPENSDRTALEIEHVHGDSDEDMANDYNEGFEVGRYYAQQGDEDTMLEGCSGAFKDGYLDGFSSWRNA